MSTLNSPTMANKKKTSTQKNSSGSGKSAGKSNEAAPKPTSAEAKPVAKPTASSAADKPRAARSSRRQKQQRTNIAIGAGIAAVIIAAIAVQVIRESGKPGQRFASQGNLHIASLQTPHVPYNSNPPTSGPHMPGIAGWGVYDAVQPDEFLVHNMEDGGVILWYQLGTPEENDANIDLLSAVSRNYSRIIIAPRENLPSKYVLTAWTRMQQFDDIDREGMLRFIEAYEGLDHHPRY